MFQNKPRRVAWLFLGLFFVLILGGEGAAQKWGKITDEEWQIQPPVKYPEAEAVVIFDNGMYEIDKKRIQLYRHVRIKVFNKDAAKEAATIEIEYYKKDKLKGLQAHTITPDGKKIKVKDKFEKKAGNYKIATFTFPALADGVVLEYKYRLTTLYFTDLDPWYFQSNLYTMSSKFSVKLYPGFTYNCFKKNIPLERRVPEEEECFFDGHDAKIFTWHLEDLMPFKDEPFPSSRFEYISALQFQLVTFRSSGGRIDFIKDWADLGVELEDRYSDFFDKKKEIGKVAQSICADLTTDGDKVRQTFDYVRDDLETRGYRQKYHDQSASEVIKNGYGSAAEKNLLLIALMRAQGYEALPLLIGTRGYSWFNPQIPLLRQFNRILCYVPTAEKEYVLDAGVKSSSFPFLPPFDLVSGGVLVNGKATRPVDMTHIERLSGSTTTSKIILHKDGSAICSTTVTVRGHAMHDFSDFLDNSPTSQEIADRIFEEARTDFTVADAECHRQSVNDRIEFNIVLEVPALASTIAENMAVSPFLIPLAENSFTSQRRFFPVDFRYPFIERFRMEVVLPEGSIIGDLPEELQLVIDGALFKQVYQKGENFVQILVELRLDKPVFSCGEYAAIKEMFEIMDESSYDKFMVTFNEE